MATKYLIKNVFTGYAEILSTQPDDSSKVIFMVHSHNREEAEAIALAIKDVYDIWITNNKSPHEAQIGNIIRAHLNWEKNTTIPDSNTYYTYIYALPNNAVNILDINSIFYIGKGRLSRFRMHFEEAIKSQNHNISALHPLDKGKIIKLRKYIYQDDIISNKAAEERGLDLVRMVAIYNSDNPELNEKKALATEKFLIQYWRGTFNLNNKTNGDTSKNEVNWYTRPNIDELANSQSWAQVVNIFNTNQSIKRDLTAISMNNETNFRGLAIDLKNINIKPINNGCFVSNNTDVHILHIISINNTPLLTLQLKMGEQDLGARINLRPLNYQMNNYNSFESIIANSFFDGNIDTARENIRVPNRPTSFFKPFAANGNGRQDAIFDIRDINMASTITGVNWLQENDLQLTLFQAFKKILCNIAENYR